MGTTGLSVFITVFILHFHHKTFTKPVPVWIRRLLLMGPNSLAETTRDTAGLEQVATNDVHSNGTFEQCAKNTENVENESKDWFSIPCWLWPWVEGCNTKNRSWLLSSFSVNIFHVGTDCSLPVQRLNYPWITKMWCLTDSMQCWETKYGRPQNCCGTKQAICSIEILVFNTDLHFWHFCVENENLDWEGAFSSNNSTNTARQIDFYLFKYFKMLV